MFNIPAAPPHFENVSEHQVFTAGSDAVVACPAFLGDPEGEMIWLRDDRIIDDDRFTEDVERLTIQNARIEDSGTYSCSLKRNGIQGTKTINVVVRPRDDLAPRISEPQNPIRVMYREPLDLTCELERGENVEYSWTIETDFEENHLNNTTPHLYRDAERFLGGRYTCRAENEYGYDEQLFFVRLLGK